MEDRADQLADRFLTPRWREVLDACGADEELAEGVGERIGGLVIDRSRADPGVARMVANEIPGRLLAFSQIPGTDESNLADSLFIVATRPRGARRETQPPQFDDATIEWLIRAIPRRTDWLVQEEQRQGAGSGASQIELVKAGLRRLWEMELIEQERARSPERDWAEPGWRFQGMIEAGVVVTAGGIGCGSPWSDWAPDFVVDVLAGEYPVRLATAQHPELGNENAAAELRIRERKPQGWELIPSEQDLFAGYEASAGVAGFGAPAAFEAVLLGFETSDDLPQELFADPHPGHLEMWADDAGTVVGFTVGPQDQDCRTWIGVDEAGEPVALVTDLGLIDCNPTRRDLPWVRSEGD